MRPFIVRTPVRDVAPLGSRRVEAAFFDLDKTVIAKASMVAFGRSFYREGLISRRLLLRALYGQLVYMYLGADEAKLAAHARLRAGTHEGVASGKGARDRRRDLGGRRRADRLRRGTRSHPRTSRGRTAHLHRLRVTGRDRRATRALPRGRRLPRHPEPCGRRWAVHGNDGAVLLRPAEGRGHDRGCEGTGYRSRSVLWVQRFGDRHTDAGVCRSCHRSQSRSRVAASGARARVGDSDLHAPCAATRSNADLSTGTDNCRGRARGSCRRRRCGVVVVAARPRRRRKAFGRTVGSSCRYAARTFRAAKAASATRTARRSSFFMASDLRAVLAISLRPAVQNARVGHERAATCSEPPASAELSR